MSDHYYSENPNIESAPRTHKVELRGKKLVFTADAGVFSKAGIDFGTKTLLEHYELPEISGEILDVGCGYGPIGITIAKEATDRQVVLVDVNERAIHLAKENAIRNQVSNVTVLKSNLLENVQNRHFASILTNPPIRAGKQVVHDLFEQAAAKLLPDGELWVVIQKKQGAPSAMEKLASLLNDVEVVVKKKGYFIIRAKNS
ncbi:16S rRNA methyltransferase [Lottiidibacillus patelloidae]|uniref:16S rRNA methyltransferase n=1 Tax=Lottiidibacillus patelloidae TaxID=2670334 RepID=A0A263BQA6_9BACI|nr:class I SAM-dependent methyltransferase [Lottiidibacillus patelloidae]OZM55894.1 16S rRNA methyltransferase [Lottiidibacillus patelloidae]